MNKKKVFQRPELTDEQIQRCHDIVDELVKLHRDSDPKHGKKSEKGKQEKAYQALNKVGELSGILTEWSENQIFGLYQKIAESKDGWIDAKTCNMHTNETMWYDPDLSEDIFEGDQKLICERLAIGAILHNSFGKYGRMAWRLGLEKSLYALNEGQVEWLVEPTNIRKQGDAYDLQELRWITVQHLYKLMGQGKEKYVAECDLSDACGVSIDAIQKWEKECVKERDKDKSTLESIKLGSLVVRTEMQEEPKNDEDFILSKAVSWNMNAEKTGDEGHLKNLSFGIISAIMLDREYPLETMKEKLSSAGLRQIK